MEMKSEVDLQNVPKIYIMVKQLSNAIPVMNLKTENTHTSEETMERDPPTAPRILAITNAGTRPNLRRF